MRIPALALQTQVENTMKHGVARSMEPCEVTIRAERDGGRASLELTRDDRAGHTTATLEIPL